MYSDSVDTDSRHSSESLCFRQVVTIIIEVWTYVYYECHLFLLDRRHKTGHRPSSYGRRAVDRGIAGGRRRQWRHLGSGRHTARYRRVHRHPWLSRRSHLQQCILSRGELALTYGDTVTFHDFQGSTEFYFLWSDQLFQRVLLVSFILIAI